VWKKQVGHLQGLISLQGQVYYYSHWLFDVVPGPEPFDELYYVDSVCYGSFYDAYIVV
jgi:hypothetical protein